MFRGAMLIAAAGLALGGCSEVRGICIGDCSAPPPVLTQASAASVTGVFGPADIIDPQSIMPAAGTPPTGATPEQKKGKTAARPKADPVMVTTAQTALERLGFEPGPADGLIGPRTRDAVRRYQAARDLPVTGRIDAALAHRLTADADSEMRRAQVSAEEQSDAPRRGRLSRIRDHFLSQDDPTHNTGPTRPQAPY